MYKFSKFYIILIFLIILGLVLESQLNLIPRIFYSPKYGYEFHPNEILQALILVFVIIKHFRFRKLLQQGSYRIAYYLRLFLISAILYSEISFVSKIFFQINSYVNTQNELNFHNLSYLQNNSKIFDINIIDLSLDISFQKLIYFVVLLFICFGSYIRLYKGFKVFFLERKYSFFFIIYFLNEIIASCSYNSNTLLNGATLISHEYIELIFYLILLFDTQNKISNKFYLKK